MKASIVMESMTTSVIISSRNSGRLCRMLKFALICKYYEAPVCSQQNKENISDIYKMYN